MGGEGEKIVAKITRNKKRHVATLNVIAIFRSSHPKVFINFFFFEKIVKFTGKKLKWSPIFNNASGLDLTKKWLHVFLWFLRNFSEQHFYKTLADMSTAVCNVLQVVYTIVRVQSFLRHGTTLILYEKTTWIILGFCLGDRIKGPKKPLAVIGETVIQLLVCMQS